MIACPYGGESEGEGRGRGRIPVTHTHTQTRRCLQQLGTHHGSLVSTLVPQLLSTHPFFMGKEPDVDDTACILPREKKKSLSLVPRLPPAFRRLQYGKRSRITSGTRLEISHIPELWPVPSSHSLTLCRHLYPDSGVQCSHKVSHHLPTVPQSCLPSLYLSQGHTP